MQHNCGIHDEQILLFVKRVVFKWELAEEHLNTNITCLKNINSIICKYNNYNMILKYILMFDLTKSYFPVKNKELSIHFLVQF